MIGPIAKPANILFTPELPRPAAARSCGGCSATSPENRPLGDTTTLADPTVVEEIRERAVSAPAEE